MDAPLDAYEEALRKAIKRHNDEIAPLLENFDSSCRMIEMDIRAGRELTPDQKEYKKMAESHRFWPAVFSEMSN